MEQLGFIILTVQALRALRIALVPEPRKNMAMRLALKLLIGALIVASLLISPTAAAQQHAPLFADHSLLQVTIEAPLTTLMDERPDVEYLDGTFTFAGNDGSKQAVDLKLRTRGNYRRGKDHCDFAPIRLNLPKKQVADTVFAGQDKLKLVTHCRSGVRYFEQLVLREYFAYRFYQLLTDKSYGVRLMQVSYVDTEGGEVMTKLAFVIEDDDDVAARAGMKIVESPDITDTDHDPRQQNLMSVFEYMIGNTEYSLVRAEPDKSCCHNVDLMSATGEPPYTPLPFDFDFAGMVNAPYAQPNPRYDISGVRTRLYKGLCRNNDLLPGTMQRFLDKRDALYAVLDELDVLRSRSKRDVTSFLNSFYKRISTAKNINRYFVEKCMQQSWRPPV